MWRDSFHSLIKQQRAKVIERRKEKRIGRYKHLMDAKIKSLHGLFISLLLITTKTTQQQHTITLIHIFFNVTCISCTIQIQIQKFLHWRHFFTSSLLHPIKERERESRDFHNFSNTILFYRVIERFIQYHIYRERERVERIVVVFENFKILTYRFSYNKMDWMLSDNRKIGGFMLCFCILFMFLGVIFFFDKALLALGNILFLGVLLFFFSSLIGQSDGLETRFVVCMYGHILSALSLVIHLLTYTHTHTTHALRMLTVLLSLVTRLLMHFTLTHHNLAFVVYGHLCFVLLLSSHSFADVHTHTFLQSTRVLSYFISSHSFANAHTLTHHNSTFIICTHTHTHTHNL